MAAHQHPSAGIWILAAAELVAAVLIAWLLIGRSDDGVARHHT